VVKILHNCPECKFQTPFSYGQSISHSGDLVWYRYYNCRRCGSIEEFDDYGFPPKEIRDKIIRSTGLWELVINEEYKIEIKLKLAKTIAETFDMGLKDSLDRVNRKSDFIWKGSEVETLWLQKILSTKNIDSKIFSV
jgi:hypothetical protein